MVISNHFPSKGLDSSNWNNHFKVDVLGTRWCLMVKNPPKIGWTIWWVDAVPINAGFGEWAYFWSTLCDQDASHKWRFRFGFPSLKNEQSWWWRGIRILGPGGVVPRHTELLSVQMGMLLLVSNLRRHLCLLPFGGGHWLNLWFRVTFSLSGPQERSRLELPGIGYKWTIWGYFTPISGVMGPYLQLVFQPTLPGSFLISVFFW